MPPRRCSPTSALPRPARSAALVAALLLTTLLGPAAGAQEEGDDPWPMVGRDAAHSGTAPGPAAPYRRAWTAEIDARSPLAGPVVAGDAVVVVARDRVVALDPSSGDVLWEEERAEGPVTAPAVAGEVLVHGSGDGSSAALVARGLEDGREAWRVFTNSPVTGALVVDGQRVYAGTGGGTVFAVNAGTGKVEWRFDSSGQVRTAPAVADGLVLVAAQERSTFRSTLHAVDAGTGEEKWRFSPEAAPATLVGSPAASGELVYAGLSDGMIHAVDLASGAERWSQRGRVRFAGVQVPAAADGDLYFADAVRLYRLDAGTGEERWDYQLGDLLDAASPAVSGRVALIGDGSGLVAAIEVDSGLLVWRGRLVPGPVGPLAVSRDRLFLGSEARNAPVVVALEHDPGGRLLSEPSPTEVFPGRALLNFLAAAVAMGVVLVGLFRLALRPRRGGEPGGSGNEGEGT